MNMLSMTKISHSGLNFIKYPFYKVMRPIDKMSDQKNSIINYEPIVMKCLREIKTHGACVSFSMPCNQVMTNYYPIIHKLNYNNIPIRIYMESHVNMCNVDAIIFDLINKYKFNKMVEFVIADTYLPIDMCKYVYLQEYVRLFFRLNQNGYNINMFNGGVGFDVINDEQLIKIKQLI